MSLADIALNEYAPASPANLMFMLDHWADSCPDRAALTFLRDDGIRHSLTYEQLREQARRIAGKLQQQHAPGERAMLVFSPGLEFVTAFFGCVYAGILATPTSYPKLRRPMSRLEAIFRDARPAVVLTTKNVLEHSLAAQESRGNTQWLAVDDLDASHSSAWQQPDIAATDICFLQYTSGSTSEPKGVIITHHNLLSNLEVIRRGFQLRHTAPDGTPNSGVFWLPAYHDMGLIGGILTPLYVGGHTLLMSPANFLHNPLRWLKTIEELQAAISGAPNFAYEICVQKISPEQRRELDLRSWRLAFCGAEPVRAETLDRFAEAFQESGFSDAAFYPCYGLAETTLLATGPQGPGPLKKLTVDRAALSHNRLESATEETNNTTTLVGCGSARHGSELCVVDPATNTVCPEHEIGEIWLHGPSVAQGYWDKPQDTARVFHAQLANVPNKLWLRTGDLGVMHEGHLYVTGRISDRIILRGRNYYPHDIEKVAYAVDARVRPDGAAAFAVTQQGEESLVVAVELLKTSDDTDYAPLVTKLRSALVSELEVEPGAIVLLRNRSLPLTTSGKIQRHLAREMFLAQEWTVLHQWNSPAFAASEQALDDQLLTQLQVALVEAQGAPISPAAIERFAVVVEGWLLRWLGERVGAEEAQLDAEKPLAEFGLDSLTAVEMSATLEKALSIKLTPVVAWNYPTPAKLARYLAQASLAPEAAEAPPPSAPSADGDDLELLLAEIENLSESEAQEALAARRRVP